MLRTRFDECSAIYCAIRNEAGIITLLSTICDFESLQQTKIKDDQLSSRSGADLGVRDVGQAWRRKITKVLKK